MQMASFDLKTIFEGVNAAASVGIVVASGAAVLLRDHLKTFFRDDLSKPSTKDGIRLIVAEALEERNDALREIVRDANDQLLMRINGTYVRSNEQRIRDENTERRLNRIEEKVDSLLARRG